MQFQRILFSTIRKVPRLFLFFIVVSLPSSSRMGLKARRSSGQDLVTGAFPPPTGTRLHCYRAGGYRSFFMNGRRLR